MGKLYLVPTPIGNLEDITLRALTVLKQVDLVLAEDTRKTGLLLKHYGIEAKLFAHHQYNEHQIKEKVLAKLQAGNSIAVVSDAGTPGISDPGYLIVRECIRNNFEVECLPGPTAFIPALIMSGIPCDHFIFEGFLPPKKGRQSRLTYLASQPYTVVLHEAPHRLLKTLEQLAQHFGSERKASVSRELTKMFEETVRGSLKELIDNYKEKPVKGEFVIIIEGK